jgi:uncharacterized protein (DUF1697 family)
VQQYVAFLRAVNVGGNTVKKERLVELFEEVGLDGVETFIASGNVRFCSEEEDIDTLEAEIEAHMVESLGWQADTFVRSVGHLAGILVDRPWADEEPAKGETLSVMFAGRPFTEEERAAVRALDTPTDRFDVLGRELYWFCRIRTSESPVKPAVLAKAAGQPVTSRNLNTIRRLVEKYGDG